MVSRVGDCRVYGGASRSPHPVLRSGITLPPKPKNDPLPGTLPPQKPLHMNKVIIVGHPASGLADVEVKLGQCGLAEPLPSRREILPASEIGSLVCRAHDVPDPLEPTREDEFQQIAAGPVWQGMALDLLVGNADQRLWGWADPKSIYLLDYWRDLDPLALFVLVYDGPQRALADAAVFEFEDMDDFLISRTLENWTAYNGAMLRFYLRNRDRCLLVHSLEVLSDPESLLARLGQKLSNSEYLVASNEPVVVDNTFGRQPAIRMKTVTDALRLTNHKVDRGLRTLHASSSENRILECYLDENPQHLTLYQELQDSADVPRSGSGIKPTDSGTAWKALVAQRRLAGDVISQLHHERLLLLTQVRQIQKELETFYKGGAQKAKDGKPKGLTGAAERVKQQLSYRLGSKLVKNSRSIGGILTLPFALISEILRYRDDKRRRGSEKLPPIHAYADANEAEVVKNQLSYRLGTVLVKQGSNPLKWFTLPSAIRKEMKAFKKAAAAKKQGNGKRNSKTSVKA